MTVAGDCLPAINTQVQTDASCKQNWSHMISWNAINPAISYYNLQISIYAIYSWAQQPTSNWSMYQTPSSFQRSHVQQRCVSFVHKHKQIAIYTSSSCWPNPCFPIVYNHCVPFSLFAIMSLIRQKLYWWLNLNIQGNDIAMYIHISIIILP